MSAAGGVSILVWVIILVIVVIVIIVLLRVLLGVIMIAPYAYGHEENFLLLLK